MSSKLIHSEKPFFSEMAVDAVMCLDQDDLDESLIGVKKIPGGGLQVRVTNFDARITSLYQIVSVLHNPN